MPEIVIENIKHSEGSRKSEFSKLSCLELSVTLSITYSLCVQHSNNDKCVTSTCFRIRVKNYLVTLLDYLSVYYMISRYYILVQSRANYLDDRRYLID